MKSDTGREVASHQVSALSGGVGPSAGCPIVFRGRNNGSWRKMTHLKTKFITRLRNKRS